MEASDSSLGMEPKLCLEDDDRRRLNVPDSLRRAVPVATLSSGSSCKLSTLTSTAKLELDDTKMVQRRLTELNYTLGSIDGKIGLQTRSAIRDFQDANGFKVTGNLDADSRLLLFSKNAMQRPVSAHRAEITATELREEGSVMIEATDQAKVGSIGAGVATIAAVSTQVSSVVTSVQQISDGVQQGMSLAQIASQYWPFILAAIATIAACYFAYVAYKGAKKAEERRVYNARKGINLAR